MRNLYVYIIVLLISQNARAVSEAAQSFTLDGRLYADGSASTPLTDNDVNVVIQILDSSQTCVLYEETQFHYNTQISNGYFTFQVGSAVGTGKRTGLDMVHPMSLVYSNTAATVSGRTLGGGACNYTPNVGDLRYLRIQVIPSSDGIARNLSPNMALDSVPMAIVAERAETVQGLGPANILQVNTSGSEVLSQSNLENIFTSSNYNALAGLLAGSSPLFLKPAANGTTPLANIASPTSPTAGQIWYDSGAIKFYNGSTVQTLGVSGAGITSLAAGMGLNAGTGPGGTITTTGTLNVDVGTTAGKILQVASGDKLPVIDGSNLTNLLGSAISGTIGGSTVINTSGNITGGALTGGTVVGTTGSFGSMSTGQLSLFDHATTNTNYITIKTPITATLTSDYSLTLPGGLPGSSGQVLTSDTSGNLTWTAPSSGSVTSVGGTAPISVTGTASAPVVNVSLATTSASGVVTLANSGGITPSTVVQATDSRLSDSRVPSGSAGGDLTSTYPNPTVSKIKGVTLTYTSLTTGDFLKYNGSAWVNSALSSADLSNDSTLLKASNMPANCAASSSLSFSSPTGTWVCTAIPDATVSSKGIMQVGAGLSVTGGTVSLESAVANVGTYSKVTVDTYGRVTTTSNIGSSDVTTALGYSPLNKAGDVMTGNLGLVSITSAAETIMTASFASADRGKMWFNSDLKKIHMWDGSAIESISSPPAPTASEDGKSVRWNNTAKAWEYFTAGAAGSGIGTFNTLTGNTQTLANGLLGTAPAWISSGTTHTLNIPMASASSVTAGLLSKLDYDTFNAKVGASYSLAGDVTGTPASTSVDKIKGKSLSYGTFTTGQVLQYDGTNWSNAGLSSASLLNDSDLLKASNMPATCAADKTLTFSSPTGTWVCSSIALAASAITSGTIADARLPASATYWQAAIGGINYAGGNVGIGTTSPAALLHLAGASGSTLKIVDGNQAAGKVLTSDANGVASWAAASGGGGSSQWTTTGSDIYYSSGKVGIGTTAPTQPLDVIGNARFAMGTGDSITLTGNYAGAATAVIQSLYGKLYLAHNIATFGFIQPFSAGSYISQGSDGINFAVAPAAGSASITTAMTIDSAANVGIGTASPGYKLDVQGGGVNASGGYTQTSDIRLKTNIEYIESKASLEKISSLRGIYYDWKDSSKLGREHQIGLIAQDVQKVFPEAVKTDSAGFLSVSYSNLVAPIVEALKELSNTSAAHSSEISAFKEEIAELRKKLNDQQIQLNQQVIELAKIKK